MIGVGVHKRESHRIDGYSSEVIVTCIPDSRDFATRNFKLAQQTSYGHVSALATDAGTIYIHSC